MWHMFCLPAKVHVYACMKALIPVLNIDQLASRAHIVHY